jgi:hypothetical protein
MGTGKELESEGLDVGRCWCSRANASSKALRPVVCRWNRNDLTDEIAGGNPGTFILSSRNSARDIPE